MEYYERSGGALAQLAWERVENYPDWKGEYFDNRRLEDDPVLVRNDGSIDFNWGNGSPASGVPSDNFSARWTREVDFRNGTYLFSVRVDDGVRLWVDDTRVIDSWEDGSTRLLEAEHKISEGTHRIKVEYYERGGGAQIKVGWQRQDQTNRPPLAVAGGPYGVDEGSQVTFDGRASSDPDGRIVNYEWDFNYDGANFNADSAGATASTIYPDGPVTVIIALRVTDDKGATNLATSQVQVSNVAPSANAGGPYNGQSGSPIAMAGVAGDPGTLDQQNLIYTWDFGDGTSGSGPSVSHSYAQPGTYAVKLSVADKDGAVGTSSTQAQVIMANQPPTAVISGPSTGLVGETLAFSGARSGDPDGQIVDYMWDLGDGMAAGGAEVTHSYAAPGTYQVTLAVTDNQGLKGWATVAVKIDPPAPANQPPTAVISGPTTGLVGDNLGFSAAGSSDPDGQIASYVWDFGDGASATGQDVTHSYADIGDYQVILIVTDDGGLADKARQEVKIDQIIQINVPPTAVISAPATAAVAEPVQFDGSGSSDIDGQIVQYIWDFGDGVEERGPIVTRVFKQGGMYQVKLTVVDNGDVINDTTHVLEVVDSVIGDAPRTPGEQP
jgi:PKD repeat protein